MNATSAEIFAPAEELPPSAFGLPENGLEPRVGMLLKVVAVDDDTGLVTLDVVEAP